MQCVYIYIYNYIYIIIYICNIYIGNTTAVILVTHCISLSLYIYIYIYIHINLIHQATIEIDSLFEGIDYSSLGIYLGLSPWLPKLGSRLVRFVW